MKSVEQELKQIAKLIDASKDESNSMLLEKGLTLLEKLDYSLLCNDQKVKFHYYYANAWNNKKIFNRSQIDSTWSFDQEEISKELYHLRFCLKIEAFEELEKELKCQIYVNLGNLYSNIGRLAEAIEIWKKALKIISYFPMALCNLGYGLQQYSLYLEDESHKNIFVYHAYKYLGEGLKFKKYIYPSAYTFFESIFLSIEAHWPQEYLKTYHSFDYNLGKNRNLANYRRWNLENCMYINPLNDLSDYPVACHDILHLPSMTVRINEPPKYHSIFNQIKQEYGTARFLLYESLHNNKLSIADKDILLLDTFDYSDYSYNTEKLKIAFRIIYAIFDKIAYLLNDYLKLGIEQHKVSLKTLWHNKDKTLKQQFSNSENLPLRGLYWLSRDLFEKSDEHSVLIEPDAQNLADIRNHIEHKSFKIKKEGSEKGSIKDDITYVISKTEFLNKTLKQMKLVRSAIIYTSLAINQEELKNAPQNVIPFNLKELDYKLKR